MKSALKPWFIAIVSLVLVVAACAQPKPKPPPTPAPTPAVAPPATPAVAPPATPAVAPPATPAVAPPATPAVAPPTPAPPPALSPEEAAWNKLIEDAKKEGLVTIYASAVPPDAVKSIREAFKAKYGITVDFLVGTGSSNIERIKTEQATKAYAGDLFYVGPSSGPIAVANKWVVPFKLPVVTREPQVWRTSPYSFDPKGETMIVLNEYPPGGMGMVINPNLVPPEREPKSWNDLLDPWWKGKIIMYPPDTSGPTMDMIAWGSYPEKEVTLPLSFWEKLAKQEPVFNRSYSDYMGKVAKGEFAAALPSVSIFAIPMFEAKLPIKQVYPKEAVFIPLMNLMHVANAPHPNAAKLFMNWSFEKDGHDLWARGLKTRGVRNDVPDYTPDYLKVPAGLPIVSPTGERIVKEQEMLDKRLGAQLFGIK